MLEVRFRFLRPVFAGDTLTSHFEVAEVKRSAGKDTGGDPLPPCADQRRRRSGDGSHPHLPAASAGRDGGLTNTEVWTQALAEIG